MKYLTFLILLLGLPLLAFAQATTTGTVNVNTDTGFVPLTNIPQLTEVAGAFSLEAFLNALYRISIGIAAVVAVLQIMRAGIMYMGSDSGFAEKKEAKNLIALSIGGLILVLSPVVVFSVINPEILTLKIGNIEKLRSETVPPARVCEPVCGTGESCVGGTCLQNNVVGDSTCSLTCTLGNTCREGSCVPVDPASCSTIGNGTPVPSVTAQNCCARQAGCTVRIRIPEGGDVLSGIPTCSCQQTGTTNVNAPLNIVKYMQLANTGTGEDRGPVGTMKDIFDRYKAACAAESKKVNEAYSDRRRCTSQEMDEYTGTASSKPYIWCVPTTLTCVAN